MMKLFIDLAERGWIPDALLRAGIRRLLQKRLKAEDLGSPDANARRLQQMMAEFAQGPIAPLPEKANEQHYEVPAKVFELMLGARRKYSCCLWSPETETLNQAETLALQTTCERAELADGMRILELGCGWGSLTLWMAGHYPNAEITAVSNSGSQREFITSRAKELGIDGNLTVLTCDMNHFQTEQTFDRVVSVEMFEHMRNYKKLMRQISDWLSPSGKLFVHIFCHRNLTYEFQDRSSSDWMSRYFFSGGIMPSREMLLAFQDDLEISGEWVWGGQHYEKTSNAWLKNMDDHRTELMLVLSETYPPGEVNRWYNRWRMFYLACAELFGYQKGNEWFVAHYLFSNSNNEDGSRAVEKRAEPERGEKVGES